MVVFNCNACGEALKKNQVEKHTLRCRHCEVLSCVDCGKDFWGNDYQAHTKCITEEEKYCGKGYVPKINKGEVKQEQWIEKVQSAIENSKSNPKLKGLLERLKDYPNIPRKKTKFENFLKNSMRINSDPLIGQVWDTLMASAGQDSGVQNGQEKTDKTVNKEISHKLPNDNVQKNGKDEKELIKNKGHTNENTNEVEGRKGERKKRKLSEREEPTENHTVPHKLSEADAQDSTGTQLHEEASVAENKLSKRERKEERRKKANKKEKKDRSENNCNDEGKKGKKRKLSEVEEAVDRETETNVENKEKKRKKKQSECEEDNGIHGSSNNSTVCDDETNDEPSVPKKKKTKKVKFNWETTILSVLQSKGDMSLKRLQKKVMGEFAAQDAANYSEEDLRARFHKKVNKMAQVKVFKDRVKLK